MLETKLFEEEKAKKDWKPTESEQKKVSHIKSRLEEMASARTTVDKYRDTYQQMIDAQYVEYPDERSSSVVPMASALIELYVAEALKIETQFLFKGETSQYSASAKALEYVRKYDWRRNRRKKVFADNEYIVAGFGTSVIYTGFEQYDKVQFDPVI